jgi:hypothetical protein
VLGIDLGKMVLDFVGSHSTGRVVSQGAHGSYTLVSLARWPSTRATECWFCRIYGDDGQPFLMDYAGGQTQLAPTQCCV